MKEHALLRNAEKVYRKQDIVYLQPAVRTADYMPMGNGDLGMQVDPFGSQGLGGWITKTDIWLETHSNTEDPLAEFSSLKEWQEAREKGTEKQLMAREESGADHYPQQNVRPRVAGRISCKLFADGQPLTDIKEVAGGYEQVLNLYDAVCKTSFTWPGKCRTQAQAFVHSDKNIAIMHFTDEGLEGRNVSRMIAFQRYRWEAGPYAKGYKDREYFTIRGDRDNQAIILEYSNIGGLKYTAVCTVLGGNARLIIDPDRAIDEPTFLWTTWTKSAKPESYPMMEGNAFFEIESAAKLDTTVLVAVVTSEEAEDTKATALALIKEAKQQTHMYDRMTQAHCLWWHEFWQKSFIEVSDPDIETFWYAQSYLVASSSRARFAPPLCMLWQQFAEWPWQGNYFDFNHAAMYSSIQAINHPELGEPYWRLIKNGMSGFRANARKLFDAQGIYMPHNYGHDGYEISPPYWRFQYYHTALVGIFQYWRYLYGMDEKILKDEIYPFVKEAVLMYKNLLVWDADRQRYNLPIPSCSLNEVGDDEAWNTRNDAFDIACIRRLIISAIEAAEILGMDEEECRTWADILAKLAPIPSDGKLFLINETGAVSGLVHTNLAVIFPTQAVDRSDPRCRETLLTPTRYGMGGQCFTGQMWAASAAWIGEPFIFTEALHSEFKRHSFPNGLLGENIVEFIPEYDRNQAFILIGESGSWLQAAISEGLCQSLYDGVIKVFAAPPTNPDGSPGTARFYSLRAAGAFLVSAELVPDDSGKLHVPFISIRSLAGTPCKVALPHWKRVTVEVLKTHGEKEMQMVESEILDGVLRFNTQKDTSYLLYPEMMRPKKLWSNIWDSRMLSGRKYFGLPVRVTET